MLSLAFPARGVDKSLSGAGAGWCLGAVRFQVNVSCLSVCLCAGVQNSAGEQRARRQPHVQDEPAIPGRRVLGWVPACQLRAWAALHELQASKTNRTEPLWNHSCAFVGWHLSVCAVVSNSHSGPGWTKLGAAWSSGECPCPWGTGGWHWMSFEMCPTPTHSGILLFSADRAGSMTQNRLFS